jgi:virginiamycin A acetyltransferase
MTNLFSRLISSIVNQRLRFERYGRGEAMIGRDVEGLKHVSLAGKCAIGRGTVFTGEVNIGYGVTISANNYIVGPVSIGNYTQIGANVGIHAKDHPTAFLSIYINKNLFDGQLNQHCLVAPIQIGNDVWIGQGCVVLKGVRIGDGAIIGAGSIVTQDIPPFSIAVGNPARVVRQRFSENLISLILKLNWWTKSVDELKEMEELFHINIEEHEDDFIRNAGLYLENHP